MSTLSIALPHKIRRNFADLFATIRLLAAADKIEKAEQATILKRS
jgi:hypothetical protein